MKRILSIILITIMVLFVFGPTTIDRLSNNENNRLNNHDLYDNYQDITDDELYVNFNDLYLLLSNTNILVEVKDYINNRSILINNAEDLYNFSQVLSYISRLDFSIKELLASQSYVLGSDINYSLMKSRRFMPIGYDAFGQILTFNGSFDGQGFEITGLYYESFQKFSYIDEQNQINVYSNYFSMFTKNEGTVKNFGLINPIIDLENEHQYLTGFSYIVGLNKKYVENIYVEDNRSIYNGGGIRAVATKVSAEFAKTAAAIVNRNEGSVNDIYFTGNSVVGIDFINAFLVEPLIYYNNLNTESIIFDNEQYLRVINISGIDIHIQEPTNGIPVTTNDLKEGTVDLGTNWHYYKDDGYPKLWGLYRDMNSNLLIRDAKDLYVFTKLIKLSTLNGNRRYSDSNYLLLNSINLNHINKGSFSTLPNDFSGTFKGLVVNGIYPQINNLVINKGVNKGTDYYVGFFSELSGTIENIVFYNTKVDLINQEQHHGQQFHVGTVAGKLNKGTIKNVTVAGTMDLSHTKIGSFNVGGIVGTASGTLEGLLNDMDNMTIGIQDYGSSHFLNGNLNLGGIVGSNNSTGKLVLYNALNSSKLNGLSNNLYLNSNTNINNNIGGIIGSNNNTISYKSELGLLSNYGEISLNNITTNTGSVTTNLGGIIGLSSGVEYDFTNRFGKFINHGKFIYSNLNHKSNIAGILNSNHVNTNNLEFTQIYNYNNLLIDNENVLVSSLINHLGSSNLTVSQAYSSSKIDLSHGSDVSSAINVIDSNIDLQLNYVDIDNDIKINNINLFKDTSIAGVTLHEKTNFLNVFYSGNISNTGVITGNLNLWISGITKVLSPGYYMKNSINEGSIELLLNIGNTITANNIFVAGLVNRNISGDLHNQDNSSMPVATTGITNSINKANISIINDGYGNVILGGITSLNGGAQGGSIQDVINVGNLSATVNKGSASYYNDVYKAGYVARFDGGIFIGGITGVVTYGQSRIFDTTNSGNILGIGNEFVRTGGILGSVLRQELEASRINTSYYYNGSNDEVVSATRKSVLSNGINYGNINAVTSEIGRYEGDIDSMTAARPGIYASSGGVIGYGLSKMVRMINHGKVMSTDVAGGIVGATTIYNLDNPSNQARYVYVDINTAINYGDIRAIRLSSFGDIKNSGSISESNLYPLKDPTSFITPTNATVLKPAAKRGFGGIFGRIQRGVNHIMSDTNGNYDLILNMNPNIDLIGRLDQVSNYSNSEPYFQVTGQQYYSAKINDFTQEVFTGRYTSSRGVRVVNNTNSNLTFNITLSRTSFGNYSINYTYSGNEDLSKIEFYEVVTHNKTTNREVYRKVPRVGNTFTVSNLSFWFPSDFQESFRVNANTAITNLYQDINTRTYTSTRVIRDGVKHISELNTDEIKQSSSYYVYDETFPLRSNSSLHDYIYYAENILLADTFVNTRPNGMYVLASSSGSTYGSVLPKNFKVSKLQKLKKDISNKIDYSNPSDSNLEEIDDNLDSYFNKLLNDYIALYQTKLNEKSELLSDNQRVEILDRNDNHLYGIFENNNFTGREIVFNINKTMITNGNYFVDFDIISALIPENAIIARPLNPNENIQNFINSLKIDLDNGLKVATTNRPDLTFDLNSGNVLSKDFVIYSEAAVTDSALFSYQTRYTLTLDLTDQILNDPAISGYRTENNNYINSSIVPTLEITNNFGIRFTDNANKLSKGYNIKQYLELYYLDGSTEVLVDSEYYILDTTLKQNNIFSFDLTFNEELRSGSYILKYRFYHNDDKKNIKVNYQPLREHEIYNLTPYNGYDFTKDINNNIEVYIPFGFDILSLGTSIETTYNGLSSYLDNKKTMPKFIEYLAATPFFDIDTINVEQVTEEGYNVFYVSISLEDGTYFDNIKIIESKLDPLYFKEGNRLQEEQYNNSTIAIDSVTREAKQTIFNLTYTNIINDFYNSNNFNFIISYNNETIDYYQDFIIFTFNNQLNVTINEIAKPGVYLIEIMYDDLPAGNLEITKLEGVSAYLNNIEFSEFVVGIEYPLIQAGSRSSSGDFIVDDNYDPAVFIGGIDYDGADINNTITNFKIFGEVSGTPLYNYLPYNLLYYLPLGSSIQRKYYSEGVEYYTELVNLESNRYLIESLYEDYTVDPKTGEFNDEEDVFIEYRVVSEDGLSSVNYLINVKDVRFNFQAVFNILYNEIPVNHVEKFDNEMILITMTNYLTDVGEITNVVSDDPSTYPTFSELVKRQTNITVFNQVLYNNDYFLYNFGSNLSGFYQIDVLLSNKYTYNIQVGNINDNNTLNDFSNYITNTSGKYYYIGDSPRMRTKIFTINITDKTPDNDWGFVDKDNPWE